MLKQFGIVGTRGRGPWVQGNNIDYVFFTPDLKPLTHDGLKEVAPQATEESQNSIRWRYTVPGAAERETMAAVATGAMKTILQRYPPKDTRTQRIPWQLNVHTAIHFASFEDRRVILVPADESGVNAEVAASLSDPAVLDKHVHNYVFLKIAAQGLPADLRRAITEAGPAGLVILERPSGRPDRDAPWESATQILATAPGPHTPATLLQLLDKHERPPGWDARLAAEE